MNPLGQSLIDTPVQRPRASGSRPSTRGAAEFRAVAAIAVALVGAVPGAAAAQVPAAAARVELQIGLCAAPEAIVRALALRPDGKPREVWFFDDAALGLYERGVRLRLRVEGGRGELTLKVANQDCARLAPGLVPRSEGKCEYDRHGESVAGAVSLERKLDEKATRRLIAGETPLRNALSAAQVRYLREIVDAWPLPPDVGRLGPASLQRYRAAGRPWGVDVWTLPGGGHVEISRKVAVADGERAYRELREEASRAGVSVCADQAAQSRNTLRALLPPR